MIRRTATLRSSARNQGKLPVLILALGLAAPGLILTARAHDPGLSALALTATAQGIEARLTLAGKDVDALLASGARANPNGTRTPGAPATESEQAALERLGLRSLEVDLDARALEPKLKSARRDEDSSDYVFDLFYPSAPGSHLLVRSALLYELPKTHRQFVSLRDEGGNLVQESLLDANNDLFEVRLKRATTSAAELPSRPQAPSASFLQFLWLGIQHILTGYDHLVFLLGLLIVGGRFSSILKIITAFTLAHSVTLALATLNVIRLSSRLVEPMIAVSIIYVGVENLFRRDLRQRWMLAFGFGLVHGCGFASVLREMGIGQAGSGVATPLVSFNVGVEIGQMSIAALILPLIWKWNQRPAYQIRFAPACSVLIALAGAYWLLERTLLYR
jgi:hydrogenase/urease accessory protein HupE